MLDPEYKVVVVEKLQAEIDIGHAHSIDGDLGIFRFVVQLLYFLIDRMLGFLGKAWSVIGYPGKPEIIFYKGIYGNVQRMIIASGVFYTVFDQRLYDEPGDRQFVKGRVRMVFKVDLVSETYGHQIRIIAGMLQFAAEGGGHGVIFRDIPEHAGELQAHFGSLHVVVFLCDDGDNRQCVV